VFEFANGARYDGAWKLAPDGKKKRHGVGKFTYNGEEYVGEWLDDQITGKGRYRFASGAVYDGSLLNGRFQGEGRYTFASGAQYLGQWHENRMHGEGCFLTPNGDRFKGTFHNDRFLNRDGSWIAPPDQTDRKL